MTYGSATEARSRDEKFFFAGPGNRANIEEIQAKGGVTFNVRDDEGSPKLFEGEHSAAADLSRSQEISQFAKDLENVESMLGMKKEQT